MTNRRPSWRRSVDLEPWLDGLGERKQEIVGELLEGHNTVEVARLHRVSRMRIFQLRRELMESWERFHGAKKLRQRPAGYPQGKP